MLYGACRALLEPLARLPQEDGQDLAEYSFLLMLIAMACILALTGLGLALAGQLDVIAGNL